MRPPLSGLWKQRCHSRPKVSECQNFLRALCARARSPNFSRCVVHKKTRPHRRRRRSWRFSSASPRARLRVAASRPMASRAPSSAERRARAAIVRVRPKLSPSIQLRRLSNLGQSERERMGWGPGGFVVLDPKFFLRPKRNTRGGRVRPAETAVSDQKSVRTKNY